MIKAQFDLAVGILNSRQDRFRMVIDETIKLQR